MAAIDHSDWPAVQGSAAGATDISFVIVGPRERCAKTSPKKKRVGVGGKKRKKAGFAGDC